MFTVKLWGGSNFLRFLGNTKERQRVIHTEVLGQYHLAVRDFPGARSSQVLYLR